MGRLENLDLPQPQKRSPRGKWPKAVLLCGVALLVLSSFYGRVAPLRRGVESAVQGSSGVKDWCPLPEVKSPGEDGLKSSAQFNSMETLQRQVRRLSAVVNVPTESFDDNGEVDEDPRWAPFDDLHALLEELFPLVYSHFTVEKVNRYGLVYTLAGSNPSLKPILLAAHQDVVPAGPITGWTHPPFDAYFDGSFLWGRGSNDCKNVLVGLMSAIEDLLSQSFVPRRGIVLAFGFDEETGGKRGAATIGKALLEEWGPDSFAFVLDEGGMGVQTVGDVMFALPGVGEKGYQDVRLTLDTVGGHSSRPQEHTGIGIMAAMIVALEQNPFKPRLTQSNPFRRVLECRVKYAEEHVDSWLKDALQSGEETEVAEKVAKELPDARFLMQTSQAVDLISGGVKINALPERVQATVNHRIAVHESIEVVNKHALDVLTPVAESFGIEIVAHGGNLSTQTPGTLTLSYPQSLVVAPVSPTDNDVWNLLSGTLRYVFETTESGLGKTVVPVGDIMTGNTDTQRYWNLTRNIYRYSPTRDGSRLNTHAADERMEMAAHVEGLRVYYDLIRNFDAWDGERV